MKYSKLFKAKGLKSDHFAFFKHWKQNLTLG